MTRRFLLKANSTSRSPARMRRCGSISSIRTSRDASVRWTTGARSNFANVSKSSTSFFIRVDSPSMLFKAVCSCSGRLTAPRRSTSRNPCIEVSGVRSSCEASATKRRICSLASRSVSKASSNRSIIPLKETPSRSISVCPLTAGNRLFKLPALVPSAVVTI
ncbi:hypothetical protein D3C76_1432020 [compost metagenome]